MDLEYIRNYVIKGEDGQILRFIPNIGPNGELRDNIVLSEVVYYKNNKNGKSFYFAEDDYFPILSAIKSQHFSNKREGIEDKNISLNFAKRYLSNVIDEEDGRVKILQFGRTIVNKMKGYESNKSLFDPRDGIGLLISKELAVPFPNYDDSEFIQVNPYNIGSDDISVKSFILNNRELSIDDYLRYMSWRNKNTRDIITELSKLGDDLKEFLKKYSREHIIDDLLSDGG